MVTLVPKRRNGSHLDLRNLYQTPTHRAGKGTGCPRRADARFPDPGQPAEPLLDTPLKTVACPRTSADHIDDSDVVSCAPAVSLAAACPCGAASCSALGPDIGSVALDRMYASANTHTTRRHRIRGFFITSPLSTGKSQTHADHVTWSQSIAAQLTEQSSGHTVRDTPLNTCRQLALASRLRVLHGYSAALSDPNFPSNWYWQPAHGGY